MSKADDYLSHAHAIVRELDLRPTIEEAVMSIIRADKAADCGDLRSADYELKILELFLAHARTRVPKLPSTAPTPARVNSQQPSQQQIPERMRQTWNPERMRQTWNGERFDKL